MMETTRLEAFYLTSGTGLILALGLAALLAMAYRRYLHTSFWRAYFLSLLTLMTSATLAIFAARGYTGEMSKSLVVAAHAMLPVFLIPLIVKLYQGWILPHPPEDRTTVRAWLRAGNLICVTASALCGWIAYDYSFWILLLLGIGLLLVYPAIQSVANTESAHNTSQAETIPSEQDRVLRMVEAGTIQPNEAAELLSALAESQPREFESNGNGVSWSGKQRTVFVGALLVLVGFVLPWFSFSVHQVLPQSSMLLSSKQFISDVSNTTASLAGDGIPHRLGWLTLALALLGAGPTLIPNNLAESTRQLVLKCATGVGGALLLYLLLENLRFTSYGLIIVLIGYGMIIAGSWSLPARLPEPVRVKAT